MTHRDASDDRSRLLREVSSLLPLLANLENQVRLAKSTAEPWFDCIKCLAIPNGPIDQLREALEVLAGKLKVSMKIHETFFLLCLNLSKVRQIALSDTLSKDLSECSATSKNCSLLLICYTAEEGIEKNYSYLRLAIRRSSLRGDTRQNRKSQNKD